MKKLLPIVLVLLFLLNDFSFISVYLPMKSLIRELNSELRESNTDNPEITVITSHDEKFKRETEELIASGEDEFVYEGELYDICEIRETNGTYAIYCIKDIKENSLDSIFTSQFTQKTDKNISKVINNLINNKRLIAYLNTNNIFMSALEVSYIYFDVSYPANNPFLGTDTPPPKIS